MICAKLLIWLSCLCLISMTSKFAYGVEMDRRAFLGGLTALITSRAMPQVPLAPAVEPLKAADMKLELLNVIMQSDFPRLIFLGEAQDRAMKIHKKYFIHGYNSPNPEQPVMEQADVLLDEVLQFTIETAEKAGQPLARIHEEMLYAFVPEMDALVPANYYKGIFPRPRSFQALGLEFQNSLLRKIAERWPRMGMTLMNAASHVRASLPLPSWVTSRDSLFPTSKARVESHSEERQNEVQELSESLEPAQDKDIMQMRMQILNAIRYRASCESALIEKDKGEAAKSL